MVIKVLKIINLDAFNINKNLINLRSRALQQPKKSDFAKLDPKRRLSNFKREFLAMTCDKMCPVRINNNTGH
jgi:hypothetical protein